MIAVLYVININIIQTNLLVITKIFFIFFQLDELKKKKLSKLIME